MYMIEINLEKTSEYVPFYSLWVAKMQAEKWAKCYDVLSLSVYEKGTGELLTMYANHELVYPKEND